MLYWSRGSQPGSNLDIGAAPFWPPAAHEYDAESYREWLRRQWRADPAPFVRLARRASAQDLTLLSSTRPDLLVVAYDAVVRVALRYGWDIDGGEIAAAPPSGAGTWRSPNGEDDRRHPAGP